MAGDMKTLGSNPRSGTFALNTTTLNVAAQIATAINTEAKNIFFVDILEGSAAFTFGYTGSKVTATQDTAAATYTGTDYGTHKAQCVDNARDLYAVAGGAITITFTCYLHHANNNVA